MTSYNYTKGYTKRRLLHGIGINDADYPVRPSPNGISKMCPFYSTWSGILTRCYSDKFHIKQPSYKNCTVSKEWHSFMEFKAWMEKQDWKDKHLDKDVMYPGNHEYGPDKCVFLSRQANQAVCDGGSSHSKYPQGVSFCKDRNKYQAGLKVHGKRVSLGRFDTINEARNAYKNAKRLLLLRISCSEKDIRVKRGLYRHSELLR